MESNMIKKIALIFLVLGLSGCFVAPGMKMDGVPLTYTLPENRIKPEFIPIDVELVRNLSKHGMQVQDDAYYYHVGIHDILSIYVWEHPEFNGPIGQISGESGGAGAINPSMSSVGFLVNPDGNIYFPMVGNVHVAGKTVDQIREELAHLLKTYVPKPQVNVRVIGFRSKKIYIMGEVMRSGLQPLTDSPISITDAINLAGGMDPRSADTSHIFVIRGDYSKPEVYWLNARSPDALLLGENFRLKNHDVIFVSTTGVARFNRIMDQILPTVQAVWMTNNMLNQ